MPHSGLVRRKLIGSTIFVAIATRLFLRLWSWRKKRLTGLPEEDVERGSGERSTAAAEPDFARLARLVVETSHRRLRLIDTLDRGRCLVAAADLPAGTRMRDEPVIPHGSDLGLHLVEAVIPGLEAAERFASNDLLAAVDFLASLITALAAGTSSDNTLDQTEEMWVLWALHSFGGTPKRVPMLRRWHSHWLPELSRVPIEVVEDAWQHVVPNWRQLTVACPQSQLIQTATGSLEMAMGHGLVCGLWLLMALCEHSCNPNCALWHDGANLFLVAVRPICRGEAITTSYLGFQGLSQPVHVRQRELREGWGFACACERCHSESAGGGGDGERARALDGLLELCRLPPGEAEAERAEYCAGLAALRGPLERLQGSWGPGPASLGLLAAVFAPRPVRVQALEEHVRACERLCGAGSEGARGARALLEDPEAYLARLLAEGAREGAEGRGPWQGARQALRVLYRRHFAARSWPRRRVGGRYLAAAEPGSRPGDLDEPRTFGGAPAACPPPQT